MMIKNITFCIALLLFQLKAFSQQVVQLQNEDGKSVSMAYVYDCNNDFIGITNDNGKLEISQACLPIKISHYAYKNHQTEAVNSPIILSVKFQDIEEVAVTPIVKMDLYSAVIEHSKEQLTTDETPIFGTYFETFMLIDDKKNDTLIITKTCQMAIQKENGKKKNSYSFYTHEGQQMYQTFSTSQTRDKDSIKMYEASSKLLPKFASNFEYDLKNTKKFKLNYDENEIRRYIGESTVLKFEKGKGTTTKTHEVEFKDSVLSFWSMVNFGNKEYTGQVIFINFDEVEKSLTYGGKMYQLNQVLNKMRLSFAYQESFARISIVNGFIPDEAVKFEISDPVSSIAAYFEGIPFTENVPSYYQF